MLGKVQDSRHLSPAETYMAVTRQKKEQVMADLAAKFKGAKSVVFSQYQGTSVKDMRGLRKQLRQRGVAFNIARKTIMRLAAKQAGYEQLPESFLEGPIGLAFGMEDEVAPAQVIHNFGKDHETVKISGAIFEGKMLSAADAKVIATLPTREVLLAGLLGMLKAPISGFHRVLHGVLRNFVYLMGEIQKKKAAQGS